MQYHFGQTQPKTCIFRLHGNQILDKRLQVDGSWYRFVEFFAEQLNSMKPNILMF